MASILLTKDDLESFKKKSPYKFEAHSFKTDLRIAGKQYCQHCGLLALNNEFTSWAIKYGCNNEDHPTYDAMRKKYTRL